MKLFRDRTGGAGVVAASFLALGGPSLQGGEQPSVQQIVQKANIAAYYQGSDGKAKVRMLIRDAQGRTRQRIFTILRKYEKDGGEQKFYVYFRSPSDVRGMVFMVWKHVDRDDDRWLYLPSLDLVKRIAASDKRTSFAGSHYFYEDVSGRPINEDTHRLLKTTDKYHVLKHTPKDPSSVEFSWYVTWIDKKTFLPTRAEYYDNQGNLYRRIEALQVEQIQGKPTVTKAVVEDLRSKGKTMVEFRGITYDIGVPESLFTERYLRKKPPSRLLR